MPRGKSAVPNTASRESTSIQMRKDRFFQTDSKFFELKLLGLRQSTRQGDIGEGALPEFKVHKTTEAAREAYFQIIDQLLADGYWETKTRAKPKPGARNVQPAKKRAPRNWDHERFGKLSRPKGIMTLWERRLVLKMFGEDHDVKLSVAGEYQEGFSKRQVDAFCRFMERPRSFLGSAEKAIYQHYQSVCPDLRDQFGEYREKWAPIVRNMRELSRIVRLTSLYVPWAKRSRTIGLLLDCAWDDSHGLAVKFVNEELKEIGQQDIIL